MKVMKTKQLTMGSYFFVCNLNKAAFVGKMA